MSKKFEDLLDLMSAHMPSAKFGRMPTVFKPAVPFQQAGTPVTQPTSTMFNNLADAGDLAGDALHSVIGHPENILSGDDVQIGGPEGPSIVVPKALGGAVDLAMLPFFGMSHVAADEAKPFFSALRDVIATRAPERGLPEQFLAIARKGAKQEELAHTGLEEFLRDARGTKVTKQEVLDHLDANAPQLHEKMIGDNKLYEIGAHPNGGYAVYDTGDLANIGDNPVPYNIAPMTSEQAGQLRDRLNLQSNKMPRFKQWTLDKGADPDVPHREMVVTLPNKVDSSGQAFENWYKDKSINEVLSDLSDTEREAVLEGLPNIHNLNDGDGQMTHEVFNALPDEYRANMYRDYQRAVHDFSDEEMGDAAQSKEDYHVPGGHGYGDPELDTNRLFHMRMSDRATAEGERALHLDELQSDWHQTGRDSGYANEITPDSAMKWYNALDEQTRDDLKNAWMHHSHGQNEPVAFEDWMAQELKNDPHGYSFGEGTVPDAPFKKTWHELGMKRMLQEAANGPYDRLTWTTGATQADRYPGLSEVVDHIKYDPETKRLAGYKNGTVIVDKMIEPGDLAANIGAEPARKLLASEKVPMSMPNSSSYRNSAGMRISDNRMVHGISGDDLRLGGHGMEGFYDDIIPRYMKKYGPVEKSEIPVLQKDASYTADGDPIDGHDLERMIQHHREMTNEVEHDYVVGMNRDELLDRLGLTEDDLKESGTYAHEKLPKLKRRLAGHVSSMDDDEVSIMYDRILANRPRIANPPNPTSAQKREIVNAFVKDNSYYSGMNYDEIVKELVDHHGYDAGDFEQGGNYPGYGEHELRDMVHEQVNSDDRSDREVISDMLDQGLIEKAPNVKNVQVHSIKMTPELRAKIKKGLPLFAAAPVMAVPHRQEQQMLPAHRPTPYLPARP